MGKGREGGREEREGGREGGWEGGSTLCIRRYNRGGCMLLFIPRSCS